MKLQTAGIFLLGLCIALINHGECRENIRQVTKLCCETCKGGNRGRDYKPYEIILVGNCDSEVLDSYDESEEPTTRKPRTTTRKPRTTTRKPRTTTRKPRTTTRKPRTTTRKPRTTTRKPRTTTRYTMPPWTTTRRPKTTTRKYTRPPWTTEKPRTTTRKYTRPPRTTTTTPRPTIPPECELVCTREYAPVCGCTIYGQCKTFPNDCIRLVENCVRNKCPYLWTSNSKCYEQIADISDPCEECSTKYEPVCAKDKDGHYQTFINRCYLDRYNCQHSNRKGFKYVSEGTCQVREDCAQCGKPCDMESRPICARNAQGYYRTFRNPCFLYKFNCVKHNTPGFSKFIRVEDGPCDADLYNVVEETNEVDYSDTYIDPDAYDDYGDKIECREDYLRRCDRESVDRPPCDHDGPAIEQYRHEYHEDDDEDDAHEGDNGDYDQDDSGVRVLRKWVL